MGTGVSDYAWEPRKYGNKAEVSGPEPAVHARRRLQNKAGLGVWHFELIL
jgi:hypothetical protein